MARMVGFTRIIRLPWLNRTLELAGEGLEPTQMRDELEEYLSKERLVEDARFSARNFGREFTVSLREG